MLQPFAATNRYFISVFLFCQQFFKTFFLPGVNVRLLSTDSPAGMEAASGKTTNELEQHRKTPAKSGITTSFLQTFSTMAAIPDILLASCCFNGSYFS